MIFQTIKIFTLNYFGGSIAPLLPEFLRNFLKPLLHRVIIFLPFMLVFVASCSTVQLEKAFKGKYSPVKNNKTINSYCQSCHIHRNFNPGEHILEVRTTYRRSLYRSAKECRICHYVEKIWIQNEMLRKTRHPYSIDRGLFRKFERDELKKIKKAKKLRKPSKPKKSLLGL